MEAETTITALLNNPLVLLFIGWVAAKWQREQGQHNKAIQVDTELLARVKFVEQWISDHNTIHGCVQSLKATTEAIKNNVDRIVRLIDDREPYELTQRHRSPSRHRGYTPPGWHDDRDDWRPI